MPCVIATWGNREEKSVWRDLDESFNPLISSGYVINGLEAPGGGCFSPTQLTLPQASRTVIGKPGPSDITKRSISTHLKLIVSVSPIPDGLQDD